MDWHRLFSPGAWIQNYDTDLIWDAALNKALDEKGITKMGHMTCWIGNQQIWVSNWPYAYGHPYGSRERHVLPKYSTRLRLREAVAEFRRKNTKYEF